MTQNWKEIERKLSKYNTQKDQKFPIRFKISIICVTIFHSHEA